MFRPILLILYINTVCELNVNGKILNYTDVTCLLLSDNSCAEVNLETTKDLNLIYKFKKLSKRDLIISYDRKCI